MLKIKSKEDQMVKIEVRLGKIRDNLTQLSLPTCFVLTWYNPRYDVAQFPVEIVYAWYM